MEAIFDTNVFVSGLMYPSRPLARLVDAVFSDPQRLTPVYDRRILAEYEQVLSRPHLAERFAAGRVDALLERLARIGVDAGTVQAFIGALPHEKDRPFVEVALATRAPIITGNARHFPAELGIEAVLPADMVRRLGP